MWKNTDPRDEIYKRATIVILRPSLSGKLESGIGHVETKNEYCVITSFENHSLVDENEKWDDLWWWALAPEKSNF